MSYGPSWRPSTWTPPSCDLWHRDETRTLRIPAEPRLRRGADDYLNPSRAAAAAKAALDFAHRVARGDDRPHVDQPGLDDPDDVRIDTVHAPREFDRQALSAGSGRRKGHSRLRGDADDHDRAAGAASTT